MSGMSLPFGVLLSSASFEVRADLVESTHASVHEARVRATAIRRAQPGIRTRLVRRTATGGWLTFDKLTPRAAILAGENDWFATGWD